MFLGVRCICIICVIAHVYIVYCSSVIPYYIKIYKDRVAIYRSVGNNGTSRAGGGCAHKTHHGCISAAPMPESDSGGRDEDTAALTHGAPDKVTVNYDRPNFISRNLRYKPLAASFLIFRMTAIKQRDIRKLIYRLHRQYGS